MYNFGPTTSQEGFECTTAEKQLRAYCPNIYSVLEGFDGHGFFTLGRSHLTSVVSNFITFMIVLIQFKQSGGNQKEDVVTTTSMNDTSYQGSQ